jgi:hypothetical protein
MSPAIPQERPLIDRMREAVPELEWRMSGSAVVGRDGWRNVVSANQRGHLLCWVNAKDEPHAVDIQYPGDTEAVRIVREWWEKTHPQPAHDPIAERGERLKALLPMLMWVPGTDAGNLLWIARDIHTEVVTIGSDWVTAFTRQQGRKHQDAISKASFATTDELIALLTKWRDATYPQAIDKVMVNSALLRAISRGCPGIDSIVNNGDAGVLVSFAGITKRFVASGSDWWEEVGDPDNTQYRQEHIVDLINAKLARVSSHEKAETMTPEYRQFIDKVSEFVEAKWSLKDGDLICEARGRVYTINHKDGKYTLRSTIDSALWVVVGVSTLDQAVASLRHRMFQPTVKERKESLALGIRHYLPGGIISENGSHSWFAVDYNGARVAVTIDDRYTVRVRGHALGVSTDSEEGAIRLIRDTLLAEAQNYNTLSEAKRIEHEMREAAAKSIVVNATVFDPVTAQATVSGLMKEGERRIALPPTPVQSDTQRNDVIATFMAGMRAMQGILDVEGIDGDLLQIVGQMDQYHVLNLTDPRTRKKHVIAYDGQWYLDGEPIIFDELLNEVLAIVTLEEEQEEPMSTRRTRAELVVDGAYLGAAKTAADNARDAVAASLASGLPAEKQENARGVIADLLRTKAGSGAVAWLLGEAIRQLPDPGAKAEKFADSLMIVGAMQGTEQALDAVVEPLKALVSGVVESLPEPEKVRAVADESQEEAHEAPRRGKRAHA